MIDQTMKISLRDPWILRMRSKLAEIDFEIDFARGVDSKPIVILAREKCNHPMIRAIRICESQEPSLNRDENEPRRGERNVLEGARREFCFRGGTSG